MKHAFEQLLRTEEMRTSQYMIVSLNGDPGIAKEPMERWMMAMIWMIWMNSDNR